MAAAPKPQLESTAPDPWTRVEALPCMLSVEIAVPRFTVGDLVRLAAGRLVDTRWTVGADVPLLINGQLIAWSEFEIVNNHVAVRLTELA
ncbi:MAG TPA: FliM/FliN family flagellar motor C-terminal domain-containing protein [Terriglobales bacterium]|nr:FliM/FliN family flagellar motor C-terminal domain-containing protein [Terriglobales bacterium]